MGGTNNPQWKVWNQLYPSRKHKAAYSERGHLMRDNIPGVTLVCIQLKMQTCFPLTACSLVSFSWLFFPLYFYSSLLLITQVTDHLAPLLWPVYRGWLMTLKRNLFYLSHRTHHYLRLFYILIFFSPIFLNRIKFHETGPSLFSWMAYPSCLLHYLAQKKMMLLCVYM